MSAKSKTRVTVGHARLTVYSWTHPQTGRRGWRWAHKDDAGKWRYHTHPTKNAAIAAAEAHLRAVSGDELDFANLPRDRREFLARIHQAIATRDDERALEDFIQARSKSSTLSDAVARYIAQKASAAGKITPHLRRMQCDLDDLAARLPDKLVSEIHLPDLTAWIEARGATAGPKRRNGIRAAATGFWRWAQREGIAGADPVPLAARLDSAHVPATSLRILTADELAEIARAIRPEFRAWLALSAFAGMRSEEICPLNEQRTERRGLLCEEIDWQFRVIRVPASASKVRRPRIIPMHEALVDALTWAGIAPGATGPVCMRHPHQVRELARIGRLVFADGKWPQNALRHTYGTARNAILRNLQQVSEEMGTSVGMLHAHYHNPQPTEFGEKWFAIRFDPIISGISREPSQVEKSKPLKNQQKRA